MAEHVALPTSMMDAVRRKASASASEASSEAGDGKRAPGDHLVTMVRGSKTYAVRLEKKRTSPPKYVPDPNRDAPPAPTPRMEHVPAPPRRAPPSVRASADSCHRPPPGGFARRYTDMIGAQATDSQLRASWSGYRTPAPTRKGPSSMMPSSAFAPRVLQPQPHDDNIRKSVTHLSQEMEVMRESLDAALARTTNARQTHVSMRRSALMSQAAAARRSTSALGDSLRFSQIEQQQQQQQQENGRELEIRRANSDNATLPRWCRWIAEGLHRFALAHESPLAITQEPHLPDHHDNNNGNDSTFDALRNALVDLVHAMGGRDSSSFKAELQMRVETTSTISPDHHSNDEEQSGSPSETISSWAGEQESFQRNLALVKQLERMQVTLDAKDQQIRELQDAMWDSATTGIAAGPDECGVRQALEDAQEENARLRVSLEDERKRSDVLREGLASITDRVGAEAPAPQKFGNDDAGGGANWAGGAQDAIYATLEASGATLETIAETENPIRAQIAFLNETIEDASREIASLRQELAEAKAQALGAADPPALTPGGMLEF